MYSMNLRGVLRDHICPYWRTFIIMFIPLILMPLPLASDAMEAKAGYVVLVIAIFWMTEALPLPVTSLLPLVMLPLMGIMSTAQVSAAYMRETNMLFIGGLVFALAIEKSCLHKRVALRVLLIVGASPRWLMVGIMLTTMFLSMWVSNTATTAMMVPIVEAVVDQLFKEEDDDRNNVEMMRRNAAYSNSNLDLSVSDTASYNGREDTISNGLMSSRQDLVVSTISLAEEQKSSSSQRSLRKNEKIRIAMFMSVAYSVKIGGTGSLIGSSPQLAFKAIFQELYGSSTGMNFATWMLFNVPGMLINTFLAWIWLQYLFIGFRCSQDEEEKLREKEAERIIRQKYEDLGLMSFEESSVLTLFVILVLLWIFRDPQFIPGWADLLPDVYIGDSAAAIAVVIIIFTIPSNPKFWRNQGKSKALLEWDYIQENFPGGLVLLLGSGFALSDASKVSGLSAWLGNQLSSLRVLPPLAIVFIICFLTASITEVASHNATANILLPILAQMAESIRVNPIYLMVPAAVTCSYAFMLPVAAPSNAMVFTAAKMKSMDMIKAGFVMNAICVVVICVLMETIGGVIFNVHEFPDWAHTKFLPEIPLPTELPDLCANSTE